MRSRKRALALLAAIAVAACGGEEPAPGEAPDGTGADSAAAAVEGGVAGASAADSSSAPDDPSFSAEPEPLPSLPGEGEARVYRLRLVNRLAGSATVFASARARRVVLDTVPGGDSVLVDIRLRADRVDLEAEDDRGRRVADVELDLIGADVNRWVIVAVSDVGSSPRTALVRGESPGYRRSRPD